MCVGNLGVGDMAEDLSSFFKWQEKEGGLTGLKGVCVIPFAQALIEVGVKIPSPPPWISLNGKSRILKKGETSVGVVIREYTPPDSDGPPWWGIGESVVNDMRKELASNWGVVLLRGEKTFESGFWVYGEHFYSIAEGPHLNKTSDRDYKVHQRTLEENHSLAQRFRTAEEFLICAHI